MAKNVEIGVGVVGVGRLGYVHAYNLARHVPGARLVAVCDKNESLGRKTAEELNCAYYREIDDLLANNAVEAVCVVTATPHHMEPVTKVAEAKKPLFCEKPLASTLEDNEKLVSIIQKSGIKCQIGFHRRFDPDFAEGERMLREGMIGKPVFIGGYSRDPFPPPPVSCDPAQGGGLFFDMMLHDFDLARFFMKDEVATVFADESNLVVDAQGIDRFSDNATAHLRFKNGGMAQYHGSWHAYYGYDIRAEIHGAEGTILMGNINSNAVTLCTKERGVSFPNTFQTIGRIPHFMYRFKEAYIREMIAFIEAIQKDVEPLVTETDALEAFKIAVAAAQSAEKKVPVALG